MDPILNCLTGVCCPPEQRERVMAKALMDYCQCDEATAKKVGAWILSTFDLAEKGTLEVFVKSIVRLHGNQEKA